MNIVGLDALTFGVEDLAACAQFLLDYGLRDAGGGRFEALDGTAVVLCRADDPSLPAAPNAGCLLRKTTLGVADAATLEAITAELLKDREVRRLADGSIEAVDDSGFMLGFQVTRRREVDTPGELSNAPGAAQQRPVNQLGVGFDNRQPVQARSLSHIVYFVPDVQRAEAFYVERLGFRCTDRFTGAGPFLQPGGSLDHHSHFLIGTPPHMQGVEHFTFHFSGPTEVMRNGAQFIERGHQAFWGPGRHILGSNWFWYFNSPFNCHIEMDADMDLHDAAWRPREVGLSGDASQAFLLRHRSKWMPGPGTPVNGDYA